MFDNAIQSIQIGIEDFPRREGAIVLAETRRVYRFSCVKCGEERIVALNVDYVRVDTG